MRGWEFGKQLEPFGDVDGDGVTDLAVLCKYELGLFSGVDGALLDEISESGGHGGLAFAGDVDGDGIGEMVVGDPSYFYLLRSGHGSRVAPLGRRPHPWFDTGSRVLGHAGQSLAVGNLDADGAPEVLVCAARGNEPRARVSTERGVVRVFDGRSGRFLYEVDDPDGRPADCFGFSVCVLPEVGDEPARGFAVGAPGFGLSDARDPRARSDGCGSVLIYKGPGEPALRIEGRDVIQDPGVSFGYSLTSVGDLDGDDRADVVVGAYAVGRGAVLAVSSADGRSIWSTRSVRGGLGFGGTVESVGDIDGDGRADVAVGATWRDYGAPRHPDPKVVVLSSRNGERLLELRLLEEAEGR